MSRSGYNDYGCDTPEEQWAHVRWRGAVTSAIRGKKGQSFLKRALAALDSLDEKELASDTFESQGQFCLLGAVAKNEGVDLSELNKNYDDEYGDDGESAELLGVQLGIAPAMAREIVWENDSCSGSDRSRFEEMRRWLVRNIKGDQPSNQ
jgi:hypothetical protein